MLLYDWPTLVDHFFAHKIWGISLFTVSRWRYCIDCTIADLASENDKLFSVAHRYEYSKFSLIQSNWQIRISSSNKKSQYFTIIANGTKMSVKITIHRDVIGCEVLTGAIVVVNEFLFQVCQFHLFWFNLIILLPVNPFSSYTRNWDDYEYFPRSRFWQDLHFIAGTSSYMPPFLCCSKSVLSMRHFTFLITVDKCHLANHYGEFTNNITYTRILHCKIII